MPIRRHSEWPCPARCHASTPTPPEWPLAHVLVVDDEAGMRNFLEKTLASRCGEVHSAADAEAGDG